MSKLFKSSENFTDGVAKEKKDHQYQYLHIQRRLFEHAPFPILFDFNKGHRWDFDANGLDFPTGILPFGLANGLTNGGAWTPLSLIQKHRTSSELECV
jgi:hypothetical protein